MAAQTEARHTGSFLLSRANGLRSMDNITIVSGQNLASGTVLGKLTSGGKYKILDPDSSLGDQVAAGILWAAVDASAADAEGAILDDDAEVKRDYLVWPDGISDGEKATALAELLARGIKAR